MSRAFALVALSVLAMSCGKSGPTKAELEAEADELRGQVSDLQEKLETARTAAGEIDSQVDQLGLAISSVDADVDSTDPYAEAEVDTSDLELAHTSLESSVSELDAALAE